MVILLLLAVPTVFINELTNFAALLLLSDAGFSTVFTAAQLHALMSLSLGLHEYGIYITQIFFGLWLVPMGYLVFKFGFLPKVLGVLLVIGGLGYLADSLIFFFLTDFEPIFASVTFIGEPLLALWLLIKGVNVEQWEERALESP